MTAMMLSRLIFLSVSSFKKIVKHVWKVAMPRCVLVNPQSMSGLPATTFAVLTSTAKISKGWAFVPSNSSLRNVIEPASEDR